MENINEIFRAALNCCLDERGRNAQADLARSLEISLKTINGIKQGRRGTKEQKKRAIAAYFGYFEHQFEDFLDRGRARLAGRPIPEPPAQYASEPDMAAAGYFKVPLERTDRLGAGAVHALGLVKPEGSDSLVVHSSIIGRQNGSHLRGYVVGGDSMEPLIADGGIVVADLARNRADNLREGAAYVINYDEEGPGAVKYLRWAEKGKRLALESENKFYKTVYRKIREVTLIGQVIWSCREHK